MNKINCYIACFCAILILLLMQPYYIWGINLIPIKFILYSFFLFNLKLKNSKETVLMVSLMCIYAIIPLVHGRNIFGFMEYVLLALIPFLKYTFATEVYKYFSKIYIALMAVSLLVWVSVLAGIPIPGHSIDPLNELKTDTTYMAYPFLVMIIKFNSLFEIVRFCSVFDEPGVIGTASLIMLYINGFNLKKTGNNVLLLSGIASLSLFFFIGGLFYLFFVLYKSKGRIATKIFVVVACVGLYFSIMNIPELYDLIGYRFEVNEEKGTLAGDTRASADLVDYISSIRGSTKYFWGDTVDKIEEFSGSAGYRNVILRFGAFFLIMFSLFWVLYSLEVCKKDKFVFWTFIFLFVATLYQRPGVVAIDYIFLFSVFFKMRVPQYFIKTEMLKSNTTNLIN